MTVSLNTRQQHALAVLVEAHLEGPDEWKPEHHDVAIAAAQVLYPLLARIEREAKAREAKPTAKRVTRSKGNPIPAVPRVVVYDRSGGFCEANTPACTTGPHKAVHVHHIAGRTDHLPSNLLHVCHNAHDYIHAHPAESYAAGWMVKRLGVNG